ncbi:MAG: flagellar motor switch protein FliM [Clostridia bacterium]
MASGHSYEDMRKGRQIKTYDFLRPEKFSREHQAALRVLHDNIARFAATNLSTHVRSAVKVSLVSFDQITYEEFAEQLNTPVVLGVGELPPLEGKIGIEFRPEITFPIIERLLGNPGEAATLHRPLTDLEAAVMRTVFGRIIEAVEEAWRDVLVVDGNLNALETSPFFTQFAPPNEMMLVAGLSVEMGGNKGRINLAWPYMMLESILPQLSLQYWMGGSSSGHSHHGESTEEERRIQRHLMKVRVPLSVELGSALVTIRDFLDIDVGDILRLDQKVEDPLTVSVEGRQVFRGWPGRIGNKMAVRLQILDEEGGNDV